MRSVLAWLALALAAALPASGQGIVGATVNGSSVSATINLPGGFNAALVVSFETVTGLSVANLGLSAQLIDPTDPTLLARLPAAASIPLGFPVLVRIEPPTAGGLAFEGIAVIGLHTPNLQYTVNGPLRLFAANAGGPFGDITDGAGAGSYRVSGSKGGFSEFLIVADQTPVDQVITAKFNLLQQILADNAGAIAGPLRADLSARLAAARADYTGGATTAAIQDLEGFLVAVEQHSGTDIPDLWRSARDLVNVAGLLRAGGRTLEWSLDLKLDLGL